MTEKRCRTALYRHFDKHGALLYVGISLSAIQRLGQHRENSDWFAEIARQEIEHYSSRELALEAERQAIKSEKPRHNIQHREQGVQERKHAMQVKESRADLDRQIVRFNPLYTLPEAAKALNTRPGVVLKMIDANKLGHVMLPNAVGTEKPYVTGWQMLTLLESLSMNSGTRPNHLDGVTTARPPVADGDLWLATVDKLVACGAVTALVRELALQSQLVARDHEHWKLRVERESLNQSAAREGLIVALRGVGHGVISLSVEVGRVTDSPARRHALRQARALALI